MRRLQERGAVATLTSTTEPAAEPRWMPAGAGRRLAVACLVALVVLVSDQLTKWWAVDRLSRGTVHLIGTLDLELERNTGSAFSQLQGETALLVALAVLLIAGLLALVLRSPTTGRSALLGLVIGGALGNLADRLFRGDHGAVVDFVALHFWPTFNLADSAIVVGSVLLAVSFVRSGTP